MAWLIIAVDKPERHLLGRRSSELPAVLKPTERERLPYLARVFAGERVAVRAACDVQNAELLVAMQGEFEATRIEHFIGGRWRDYAGDIARADADALAFLDEAIARAKREAGRKATPVRPPDTDARARERQRHRQWSGEYFASIVDN